MDICAVYENWVGASKRKKRVREKNEVDNVLHSGRGEVSVESRSIEVKPNNRVNICLSLLRLLGLHQKYE